MSFERMTDEELVAAARDPNPACFDDLFKRHWVETRAFVGTRIGQRDADDITQEVWLRAWRALDRFDPGRARFKTWIMAIAGNRSKDFIRERERRPKSVELDPEQVEFPGDPYGLEADRVHRELAKLEPDERAGLMLREWGYAVGEVAVILGIEDNPKHSKTNRLLHEARKKLRPLLEEDAGGGSKE